MRYWSLALHGPSGILQTIDTGESEFVLGAETGQVFDLGTRYTKQEEIGRGGMARILSAKDAHLERLVAVKVSTADDGDGGAQFLYEADVLAKGLAKLAHPNIVPIHNRRTDEFGRPFYSIKLVEIAFGPIFAVRARGIFAGRAKP